jgi:hypothetical protein
MKAAVLEEMGRDRPYSKSKPLVIQDVDLEPPGFAQLQAIPSLIGMFLCALDGF